MCPTFGWSTKLRTYVFSRFQANWRTWSQRAGSRWAPGPGPTASFPLLSSRAALGHLGVGRHYTGTSSLLQTRRLNLPGPPLPDFARLRADAQRLQQQLAAHDSLSTARPAAAPAPRPVPFHAPMMTPAMQARLKQERMQRRRDEYIQYLLVEYNHTKQALYLGYLGKLQAASQLSLLRKMDAVPTRPASTRTALTGPAPTAGTDCFMPPSFWKSQNPYDDPKVGWKRCCATVKEMVGYNAPQKDRTQIVKERGRSLVVQPSAAAGFRMLNTYMNLRKPVMTGVNHTYATGYNEGTTDHFIAIVGTGTDAKGKYYRFFDVGTTDSTRGTDPRNRLYYDSNTDSYSGKSQATGRYYTVSQLRFKPGTF